MPGIVTITFNPCIDKSTTVSEVIPEAKLHCTPPKFEPGGGGINVARAIKKLGGEAVAIYPAGGYSGKFLNVLLDREGVNTAVVETANHTRENMIVLEVATNKQFRFGMPGSLLLENEWMECLRIIEQMNAIDFIVASGSLPPGVPTDIFARIARTAKAKNAKLIVDTSEEPLRQAIAEGVYLIKPNLKELSLLSGKDGLALNEVYESASKIVQDGKSEVVVVSLGAFGAMLVTKNEFVHIVPPVVDIKSTVGAGDSMVAGIVLSLSKGSGLREAVQYGVACGTAATINFGTELCKLADVEKIYLNISSPCEMPVVRI